MEEDKSKSNFPIWAWALGCLALITICGVLVVIGSAGVILYATRNSGPAEAITVVAVEPRDDTGPADDPPTDLPATNTPEANSTADDSVTEPPSATTPTAIDAFAAERAEIEANVVEIRALRPKESVIPSMLTTTQLRQRLEEEFAEDYGPEEARQDAITLSAFDFLSPDFDIYNFILDLYTEEIAGFYDPESDEFVIIGDDEEFDTIEQWTHAHEYVHALQDQHYDLEILSDDSLSSEEAFALQALAEGDATLVQTLYLTGGYFDQQQLFELLGDAFDIDTAVLDSAPPILAHELEFPYISGLAFVQALHDSGGFAAVDQAWENLPQSTEHILHPDRYLAGDVPQLVSVEPLTDTLGTGWQLVDEDSLGEFYLREYLSQQLDDDQVDSAATGWGGDGYAVYWNEDEQAVVMVLKITWDTPADADDFNSTYVNYPTALFGVNADGQADGGLCWRGEDVICLYEPGGETLIVRAPDVDTATAVAAAQLP